MKCPTCDRSGQKRFKGYCCKSHYKLSKKPLKLKIPCENCGQIQIRNPSQVSASGKVYCKRCKKPRGELHYRFKGSQTITGTGYRSILVNGRYFLEHRYNWEIANKSCLLPWASGAIHHINFIGKSKLDNEPENLILLSHTEHGALHRAFDSGDFKRVKEMLQARAKQQAFYPKEVDKFLEEFCSTK